MKSKISSVRQWDELEEMLDIDLELPENESRDATWFTPEQGIEWLNAVIPAVQSTPDQFDDADSLIDDLETFRRVLEKAAGMHAK